MPPGGARNRSGPRPDPNSGRSERRSAPLALPAEGYQGPVPEFPLPDPTDREVELWERVWRTPQAAAWVRRSERWRWDAVARWCKLAAASEEEGASLSIYTPMIRFADQVGLTTAGLRELNWVVAADEIAEKASEGPSEGVSARDRARALGDLGKAV